LFNGVTEYADYHRTTTGKTAEEKMQNRADSLLFGSGAKMKQTAMDSIVALTA